MTRLGTKRARADPCLLFTQAREKLSGMDVLQDGDSFTIWSEVFLELEDQEANSSVSSSWQSLDEKQTPLNEITISKVGKDSTCIKRAGKIDKLKLPRSEKTFASRHALEQYIGAHYRSDACAGVQLDAPGTSAVSKS